MNENALPSISKTGAKRTKEKEGLWSKFLIAISQKLFEIEA